MGVYSLLGAHMHTSARSRWAAAFALLGLSLPAAAGNTAHQTLSWGEVPFVAAQPESKALGPDLLAARPGGAVALWDPVDASVWLIRPGKPPTSFAAGHADDLAWTGSGLLLLDDTARRLVLLDLDGKRLATMPLPDLAPLGLSLAISGDQIDGADLFGNRHPLARLSGSALVEAQGPALRPPAIAVRWNRKTHEMEVGDRAYPVPGALKASGRVLGDMAQGWLIIDAVTGDGPLVVKRTAIPLGGGDSVGLPVDARLYAPTRDLAVDASGHLFVLVPESAGLSIWEVTP